jgi:hypothetical protein
MQKANAHMGAVKNNKLSQATPTKRGTNKITKTIYTHISTTQHNNTNKTCSNTHEKQK